MKLQNRQTIELDISLQKHKTQSQIIPGTIVRIRK